VWALLVLLVLLALLPASGDGRIDYLTATAAALAMQGRPATVPERQSD
jgi:hypothetical protein